MITIEHHTPARDYAERINTNSIGLPMAIRPEPHPLIGAAALLAFGVLLGAVLFS